MATLLVAQYLLIEGRNTLSDDRLLSVSARDVAALAILRTSCVSTLLVIQVVSDRTVVTVCAFLERQGVRQRSH